MSFKSSPLFEQISKAFEENKSLREEQIKKVNSTFAFDIKNKQGETKVWLLDLKSTGKVSEIDSKQLEEKKPDIVIKVNDLDFKKLALGKSNPQKLFMSGKLKIKGNVMKAASIQQVLQAAQPPKAKL